MAPNQSHLQAAKYGYDVVVSTTQESINNGLIQYLQNTKGKQPVNYLFFLAGEESSDPTVQVPYDDFMKLSGNINPFDIPNGTDWTDSRIQKLFEARMVCAIRIQAGIPPGMVQNVPGKGPQLVLPEPVVTLGKSAESVLFNMYCSDVSVIKNTPPGGWVGKGKWEWFVQPSGKPWYVQTRTNLMLAELDKNLNTDYFLNHPDERQALLDRLINLSGSAFSLQQLMFNLDSAVMQTTPDFEGVTDESAAYLLGLAFTDIWASAAKAQGLPLIGVTAVAKTPDGSPLQLTGLERWISPVVDPGSGAQIQSPSDVQIAATTLNYLCAVSGNALRGPTAFEWNWVEPADVGQASGVMAIRRHNIARFLVDQMLPQARLSCIEPWTLVEAYDVVGGINWYYSFTPGQEPGVSYWDDGPMVATMAYKKEHRSHDQMAATYGELNITSSYMCTITLGSLDFFSVTPPRYIGGNRFTITQNLKIHVYNQWALSSAQANMVNITLTDEYAITVDEYGNLATNATGNSTCTDESESGDANAIINFFTGVNDLIDKINESYGDFLNAHIQEIPFDQLKNFVFPGAKVFSYQNASFSDWQDLTSLITYVNPTDGQFPTRAARKPQRVKADKIIHLQKLPPIAVYAEAMVAKGLSMKYSNAMMMTSMSSGGGGSGALSTTMEAHPSVTRSRLNAPNVRSVTTHNNAAEKKEDGKVNGTTSSSINPFKREKKIAFARSLTGGGGGGDDAVRLSGSTDLMLNYVQGTLVQPMGKFRALQTDDGDALLFAIDSEGVFNVIRERSGGQHETGWTVTDLSSKIIGQRFGGKGKVRQFDVAQSVMDNGTIGLGMAVRVDEQDFLLLSLYNPADTDTSAWLDDPKWIVSPFDAANKPSSIQITNIYFSETEQKTQYILVDIIRDPSSPVRDTARYIVDPSSTSLHWSAHELPFDVEEGTYQSVTGRNANAFVDGIYTAGTIASATQLAYVPLFNIIAGGGAPMPVRLKLPGNPGTLAIASARNDWTESEKYATTDLYVISGSTLFRWDPEDQVTDSTEGTPILTSPVFAGTDSLIALVRDRVATIFGKNASDQAWYTSCSVEQLSISGAWSVPVPILNGVERITSFINVRDNSNTIFAAGGNKIWQLIQATTSGDKIWQSQAITIAAPPRSPPLELRSYTTIIKATSTGGDDDGMPVPRARITLTTAGGRTPVYISGLYYVLSPTISVTVEADSAGQVTVVQATDSLVGAVMYANISSSPTSASRGGGIADKVINPMRQTFAKLSSLENKDSLRAARLKTDTVAGGVLGGGTGGTKPLVPEDVEDGDLESAAGSIKSLKEAYLSQDLSKRASSRSNLRPRAGGPSSALSGANGTGGSRPAHAPIPSSPQLTSSPMSYSLDASAEVSSRGFGDAIATAFGDLWNWIKSGVSYIIEVIETAVSGLWRIVVRIADKVYAAILDSIEAVIGAFEWVFDKIKAAIEDVITYLQVLFEWDDIRRTKDVMTNLVRYYLEHMVDGIDDLRDGFKRELKAAQGAVGKWAGVGDWSSLGDAAGKPPGGQSRDPTEDHTPASELFSSHFRNQAHGLEVLDQSPELPGSVQSLVDQLMDAIAAEGQVFSSTFDALQRLAGDFLSLSLEEILKRLARILAEAILGTAGVVVDALFGVLGTIARSALDLLDTKLHIPVISDILNAVGVPDISFLDLMTWIAAVGVTVIYKIANDGEAPFPDNSDSTALVNAKNWEEFSAAVGSPSTSFRRGGDDVKAATRISSSMQSLIFTSGHATAGFISFAGSFLVFAEAMDPLPANPFGIPCTVLGVISALAAGGANQLVPKLAIENQAFSAIGMATTAVTILAKVVFSGPGQKYLATGKLGLLKADDNRKVGAVINGILVIPGLITSGWHFYELAGKEASRDRTCAIIGETSSLLQDLSRLAYMAALLDPDLITRVVPAGVMAASNVVVCGLETAEAVAAVVRRIES